MLIVAANTTTNDPIMKTRPTVDSLRLIPIKLYNILRGVLAIIIVTMYVRYFIPTEADKKQITSAGAIGQIIPSARNL